MVNNQDEEWQVGRQVVYHRFPGKKDNLGCKWDGSGTSTDKGISIVY